MLQKKFIFKLAIDIFGIRLYIQSVNMSRVWNLRFFLTFWVRYTLREAAPIIIKHRNKGVHLALPPSPRPLQDFVYTLPYLINWEM